MSTDHTRARETTRVLLLLAVAMIANACAGATRATPETAEGVRLDARLLSVLDSRQQDTTLIDQLLENPVAARRARAALAVGQLHMRSRYGRLRRLLVDADTAVAANAAFALGLGQDSASVVMLGRAVAGAPDVVAAEAAWALGQIGEPARAVVAFALGDGASQPLTTSTAAQRAPSVRAELLTATFKIRSIAPAVVLPWLADSAVESVRAAAYVIARGRVAAGVRPLLALAHHHDELVRQHVARALSRAAAGDSLATRARDVLTEMLADTSPRVRANAAGSLSSYGAAARTAVERALADRDPNVRIAALAGIIGVFGSDGAAWRAAWNADTTFTVRRTLLSSARRAGSNALAEEEPRWQADADWRRRAAVVDARAAESQELQGAERLKAFEWALNDTDARVRAQAIGALASGSTGEASVIRERLLQALRDPDVQVRGNATSALMRSASAATLSPILDAYTVAQRDADADARLAALRYIAQAWTRDSAAFDRTIRDRLRALPISEEPVERAVVRRVEPLSAWRARGDERTPRALSEYEDIVRHYLAPQMATIALLRTERGNIRLMLYGNDAPLTVDAFVRLARRGFYKNTRFHRVVPNFVAQDGDPRGDGSGGAGFFLRDELTRRRHLRGCLGVATSGPETGGSQYYLCHSPQPHLDGSYTVFGQVIDGFDVLDRLVQGDRVIGIDIQ